MDSFPHYNRRNVYQGLPINGHHGISPYREISRASSAALKPHHRGEDRHSSKTPSKNRKIKAAEDVDERTGRPRKEYYRSEESDRHRGGQHRSNGRADTVYSTTLIRTAQEMAKTEAVANNVWAASEVGNMLEDLDVLVEAYMKAAKDCTGELKPANAEVVLGLRP